jgi:TRAP-type C4-dicarboxylate transport system permease small subunit
LRWRRYPARFSWFQHCPGSGYREPAFTDYTVPALALGIVVGGGSGLAALLLILNPRLGRVVSVFVGLCMAIFEMVEVTVVGLDIWLHTIGLMPTLSKGLPGTNLDGVPTLLGVPLPLWQQPLFFGIGIAIIALALLLTTRGKEAVHDNQVHFAASAPWRHR